VLSVAGDIAWRGEHLDKALALASTGRRWMHRAAQISFPATPEVWLPRLTGVMQFES